MFAQQFALSALIRSGRVAQDPSLAPKLAATLLQSLQSKSFLREVSAVILLELLEPLSASELKTLLPQVEGLTGYLQSPPQSATSEVCPQKHSRKKLYLFHTRGVPGSAWPCKLSIALPLHAC